ncbi:hypothetical protein [uncultured Erythrobacter sp.]|uniref:hypothetical protein n=1 Tax=uncultured Erythrobacter sp. TaxID=263913 RepID=UPI0026386DFE|nr:hypothetical protein [uncultured Erythrobacter sp.]
MRLTWWAALAALAMMYFGGSGLYTYFTIGEKQTITIEELIAGGPATGWYEITGAEWNELETLYQENDDNGRIRSGGMLVLVRPQGTDRFAPVHVLLQQDSSEIASKIRSSQALSGVIRTAENYIAAQEAQGAPVDEAQIQPAIEASEQMDAMFAPHEKSGTIEGLVTASAPGTWSRTEVISTGEGGVAADFVTVEPGFEPEFWSHAGLFGGGLLLLLVVGGLTFGFGGGSREDDFAQQDFR